MVPESGELFRSLKATLQRFSAATQWGDCIHNICTEVQLSWASALLRSVLTSSRYLSVCGHQLLASSDGFHASTCLLYNYQFLSSMVVEDPHRLFRQFLPSFLDGSLLHCVPSIQSISLRVSQSLHLVSPLQHCDARTSVVLRHGPRVRDFRTKLRVESLCRVEEIPNKGQTYLLSISSVVFNFNSFPHP